MASSFFMIILRSKAILSHFIWHRELTRWEETFYLQSLSQIFDICNILQDFWAFLHHCVFSNVGDICKPTTRLTEWVRAFFKRTNLVQKSRMQIWGWMDQLFLRLKMKEIVNNIEKEGERGWALDVKSSDFFCILIMVMLMNWFWWQWGWRRRCWCTIGTPPPSPPAAAAQQGLGAALNPHCKPPGHIYHFLPDFFGTIQFSPQYSTELTLQISIYLAANGCWSRS